MRLIVIVVFLYMVRSVDGEFFFFFVLKGIFFFLFIFLRGFFFLDFFIFEEGGIFVCIGVVRR